MPDRISLVPHSSRRKGRVNNEEGGGGPFADESFEPKSPLQKMHQTQKISAHFFVYLLRVPASLRSAGDWRATKVQVLRPELAIELLSVCRKRSVVLTQCGSGSRLGAGGRGLQRQDIRHLALRRRPKRLSSAFTATNVAAVVTHESPTAHR